MAEVTRGVRCWAGMRARAARSLTAPHAQGRRSLAAQAKPGPLVLVAYQRSTPLPVMVRAAQSIAACTRSSFKRPKPIMARRRLPLMQCATADGGGLASLRTEEAA